MVTFKKNTVFLMVILSGDWYTYTTMTQAQQILQLQSWHLKFFQEKSRSCLTGKNTTIIIIDSASKQNFSACITIGQIAINSADGESILPPAVIGQKNENRSPWSAIKKQKTYSILKNHENISLTLIRQLAPDATIISIPILDEQGYSTQEQFYQALVAALQYNPDIVHLGFQILDFDLTKKLEKKIYKILKRFKCIIVPLGNNIPFSNFPPKLPNIFTIASFACKNNKYPISSFCNSKRQADFIMPGEDLQVIIPDQYKTGRNFIKITVSGTSFAAALMTGQIAYLLQCFHKNITHVQKFLKKNSTILDASWREHVRYGFASTENLQQPNVRIRPIM